MNKRQKAREYTSPIIEELNKRIDPVRYKRTEKQMMLAAKIDEAISEKFGTKVAFAEKIGKKPSEITKWLSGFHNFTLNTLLDLEQYLGIEILFVEEPEKINPLYIINLSIPENNYSTYSQGYSFKSVNSIMISEPSSNYITENI